MRSAGLVIPKVIPRDVPRRIWDFLPLSMSRVDFLPPKKESAKKQKNKKKFGNKESDTDNGKRVSLSWEPVSISAIYGSSDSSIELCVAVSPRRSVGFGLWRSIFVFVAFSFILETVC